MMIGHNNNNHKKNSSFKLLFGYGRLIHTSSIRMFQQQQQQRAAKKKRMRIGQTMKHQYRIKFFLSFVCFFFFLLISDSIKFYVDFSMRQNWQYDNNIY